ncbi:MAG: hypothetical protein GY823_05505, partial [Flavobacteriaceae bacterium]|nr:hypothetical protein [Flavobacteriaceae bacterium]
EMYKKYSLDKSDVFKHQHYIIITRSGIEKVMGYEKIDITYDVIKCEPTFAVIKAYAKKGDKVIETFGSALKGSSFKDSSTNTWYVAEMAEKRALSRAVLKMTGLYELGIFGEDESEDFKRK